jgi:hypothetical protein
VIRASGRRSWSRSPRPTRLSCTAKERDPSSGHPAPATPLAIAFGSAPATRANACSSRPRPRAHHADRKPTRPAVVKTINATPQHAGGISLPPSLRVGSARSCRPHQHRCRIAGQSGRRVNSVVALQGHSRTAVNNGLGDDVISALFRHEAHLRATQSTDGRQRGAITTSSVELTMTPRRPFERRVAPRALNRVADRHRPGGPTAGRPLGPGAAREGISIVGCRLRTELS